MAVRQQSHAAHSLDDTRLRLLLAGSLIVLLFVGVVARLLYLQTVKASELRRLAARYGGLRVQKWTLFGRRGQIKDRAGNILAMDVNSLSITIRSRAVTEPAQVAATLSPIVGIPATEIERRILERRLAAEQTADGKQRTGVFVLKREISGEKAEMLKAAREQERKRVRALRQKRARQSTAQSLRATSWLDGVDITEEPRRQYPYGSIASALIGFTDPDQEQGQAGIERLFDDTLSAKKGEVRGIAGARGQILAGTRQVISEPRNGSDVQLTIDVNVQSIAEGCLEEVMQKHQPAGACALVMDVHTGDLLAVANVPRIDLNERGRELKEHGLGVMRNMAFTFLFEPGSTFKPITIAAALEEGRIRSGQGFYCAGSAKVGKHTIRCAPHGGRRAHGFQTLEEVVAHSCNVATAQIGLALGATALYRAVERFGMLERPVVGSLRGRLEPPEKWQRIRVANVAFGQGVQVTPVALLAAYAVIANDGVYVKPRLLMSDPFETSPVLSPEVAQRMRQYLRAVVEEGTGELATVHGYEVAGKTGTAQKVIPGRRGYASGKYVASFVGFAPADNPRIAVLVVVDEPRNGHYGGVVAAPAFARITERVLAYLGVPANLQSEARVSNARR